MANKLLKPKRGKVENLPKLAVEDGSLIFAYDTKSPTSTVLVDVGETRYELSAATAKKADDSNALGGSSLNDIVTKIDNSTGSGSAFTGLDTTTNNKVKLTRANGGTVEKTINNVSNASTADYSKVSGKVGTGTVGSATKPVYINAGTPTAITSIPSTFVAAQQINGVNLDTLRTPGMYYAQGSNTNTNKPAGIDAFALEVIQSAGGWYTQVCYASNNQEKQFIRYYNSGTNAWGAWVEQNRLNTKTQSGYAPAPNAANKVYRTDANGNPGWGTLNDSSISKLASTVTFGAGNGAMIDQNGETYRQRINIFDNATADDAVFSFQQSSDAGKNYKDLFVINDNGTVVASTFQGALKGTADYSKNSGALGGSSLKNIVDKINSSTGSGSAFTELDTTENNKIKLTRANGGIVEKTVNNVSHASTADYAKTASAGTANYLYRNPASRSTSANLAVTGAGGLRTFKATSGMTEGKPPWDSHVLHMDWDSTGGWSAQIAVAAQNIPHMAIRGMQGTVWNNNWLTMLDSANYTSYAAKKNAYNSASISNATITLGRSDGSTGTTLTVNNVSHASTADLAKNSNALGGSSLKNITDKIDSSIAANDAMHYMGTIGATAQSPTITSLPTTARTGDAYKVVTAGTYASIVAEVGDLFIYSGSWTLIPSGDDGNVYVGDSKSSKFAAKSNNIVIAVGDQKVASAANVTANAGTISALQSTMTQLKANQGTVTTLHGTNATFDTFTGFLNGTATIAQFVRSADTRSVNTLPSTYISTYKMGSKEEFKESTAIGLTGADQFSHVITHIPWNNNSGGRPFQVAYSGTKMFIRGSASDSAWGAWYKVITGGDALTSSASAIASTNNYFTAGATTALIAAKTASAVGNYLPLTGGTLTGNLNFANASTGIRGITGTIGDNDYWRIVGGAATVNSGYLELATGDDTNEPIYVRQYSGKFTTVKRTATLLDGSGNTSFPGQVTATTFKGCLAREGKSVSWKDGNGGDGVLINQTSYTGYNPIIRAKTSNGVWTFGPYESNIMYLNYTADTTIASTVNKCDRQIRIYPSGNVDNLNVVTASTFTGYLNGNAKNADTVDGFHAVDSNSLTASATSAKIVLAKNIVSYINSLGLATTHQLEWIEF